MIQIFTFLSLLLTQQIVLDSFNPEADWKKFIQFGQWMFKDDAETSLRSTKATLTFNFWDLPDFAVKYDYNPTTNTWDRTQGGKETGTPDEDQAARYLSLAARTAFDICPVATDRRWSCLLTEAGPSARHEESSPTRPPRGA